METPPPAGKTHAHLLATTRLRDWQYSWMSKPSLLIGAASVFDIYASRKWWNWLRFAEDEDGRELGRDYLTVARDLRTAYYKTLREHGVEPPEVTEDDDVDERQTSFFEDDRLSARR